jgi:hypothetical protein
LIDFKGLIIGSDFEGLVLGRDEKQKGIRSEALLAFSVI